MLGAFKKAERRMPLYRVADKILLFVHIPKTGGSTVEEVIKKAGAAEALKYHKRLGYSAATPQHMHWELLRSWIKDGFYDYAIGIVRDPYARLISEYRWRQALTDEELPPFDTWVNHHFDRYAKHPFELDNHIRPQSDFISKKVEVFKLEDGLDRPIQTALEKLGLPFDGVKIHHARKSEHSALAISEQTLDRVRSLYSSDFKAFDYNPDKTPSGLNIHAKL